MPDTTLDIGVRGGREGKAIIDAVTLALRLLGQQNAANAREAKGASDAAQRQADQLRGLAAAARTSLENQKSLLASLQRDATAAATASNNAKQATIANSTAMRDSAEKALATQRQLLKQVQETSAAQHVASIRTRADAVSEAQNYAKSAEIAAKGFQKIAAERLKAAQAVSGTAKIGGLTVTTGPDRAVVAQRRRELADANENLARARALGKLRIQNAQQVGTAEDKAARQSVEAQKKVVAQAQVALQQAIKTGRAQVQAAQQSGAAQVKAAQQAVLGQRQVVAAGVAGARQAQQQANAANRAAAQQVAAVNRANQALRAQQQGAAAVQAGLNALRNTVLRLVAAYAGFQTIKGFVTAGLQFNQVIETSKLGIGALITAEADLFDKQGNLITGAHALAAAQGLAADQLTKLRIAGIQTSATTEALVTAFQEAVGAGISVGLTLDQIRVFTVQVAQAASTINLPFSQLNQEVRSILQGTIDRNSRIAKALQLTNAQINQAKEQGRLADLLNEKFKAFNVAGVESVKTFAGLRSNIQDAFSVLAGAATQPLFDSLKKAGLDALSAIFDFKSASIQKSFQGLIDGAAIVFKEIGNVLAEAIAIGVEKAKALSEFFARNREEVKKTAAALGTMVRTFGEMISSIVATITGFATLGDKVNTITAVARALNDIFELIRDNIGKIIVLLAARSLITTLGAIVGLIVQIRTAATGAAIGTAIGGPGLGTAIGGIIGLLVTGGLALKLFGSHEAETRRETARLTTELQDQQKSAAGLAQKYVELQQAAQAKGVSDDELKVLQAQLTDIIDEFSKQGGPGQAYLKLIRDGTLATGENTAAIKERIAALFEQQQAEAKEAFFAAQSAQTQLDALQKQRSEAEKQGKTLRLTGSGRTAVSIGNARELKEFTARIEDAKERLKTAKEQAEALNHALQGTFDALHPPTIKTKTPPLTTGDGVAPAIKAAKAELERTKAELDVARAKVNAEFAARVIDAETQLRQLLQIDLAEVAAERKLLEAERVEAERKRDRVIKGESPDKKRTRQQAAQDVVNAILIQEQGLGFKEVELRINTSTQLIKIDQDRADKEEEIRIRALKAHGQILDAELAESALKQRQALRQFDQENDQQINALKFKLAQALATAVATGIPASGLQTIQDQINHLLDIKAMIKFAVDHESFDDALKAFNTEIQRILETRTAQEQAIRARFKLSGTLSSQEQQALSTALANVNKQAADEASHLRDAINQVRQAAVNVGDFAAVAGFDALLAKFDAIIARSKDVDVEMEKLRDGFRQALEGGIGTFFEEIGDRTKTLADLFKDMVTSIIKDMQRLVSQLLAQRITEAVFKLLGLAVSVAGAASGGGQQRGNTTQSGGRAQGGSAGPRYGRLQGGIPGIDSIPILAQQDEWFLRPSVRRKYGDAFLRELNELRLPVMPIMSRAQFVQRHTERFAQGGPVDFSRGQQTARESRPQEISLNIGVDRGGMLRVWQGPVGKKLVTDHVKASRRELGNILIPRQRPA